MSELPGPRRLVLLRHGRTAWNQQNRAQGQIDIALDTVGHAQAAGAGPELAKLRPVRLWSSDLTRALETAEYVARATGLEILTDPRLREFELGERSGLTPAEFAERFPDEYADWGLAERPVPGEQTRAELAAQVEPALREYVAALAPGQTGIAVLHGASAKVVLAVLLGWPLDTFDTMRGLDNARWAIFQERKRDSRLRLAAYNLSAPPLPAHAQFASDGAVG